MYRRVSICLLAAGIFTLWAIQANASEADHPKTPSALMEGSSKEGTKGADLGPSDDAAAETGLDAIVVTATRQPTPTRDLPVRTQVISRKQIDASHAKDLSELLSEEFPGDFVTYPGSLSSVGIRGFRTDTMGTDIKGRVAILIDGNRAGTGNIAVIPLENVERIEIVRGPGSVVYGSAAMGGVINIITRKGTGKPSVDAGLEGGSFGYIKGRAGVTSSFLEDKAGVALTARSVQSGDYRTGDGSAIENSAYHDQAYSMSLWAAPAENHRFFATGHFFNAWDVGTPGPTYSPDLDDNKDITRYYGSLTYDGSFPGSDVNWHLSLYDVFDQNKNKDPSGAWGYWSSTTETETRGLRSQLSIPTFSVGKLLFGFDYDNISVSSSSEPAGNVWTPDSTYDNYAVFAEEKVDWNRFSISAGLRYDYFDEAIKPTEGMQILEKNESFDHISWRTGAKYSLLDWLLARGAVGTGFRAPTADELAGRFEETYIKTVGNPNLKPETATTYEAGLDADFLGINTGLTFFYTDYKDRISGGFSTCVDGDCSWTTFKNVEGAVLSGLEGYLKYIYPLHYENKVIRFIPFSEFTYFTQLEVNDKKSVETLGTDQVLYVSRAVVTGGLKVDFNRKVDWQFTAAYHGPQKVQDWNWLSPDYGKAVDKDGFALFSTRFAVHPTEHFSLYFLVDNLLDESYSWVNGYPMPGRTFRIGAEARF